MSNAYKVTDEAMKKLHDYSRGKLSELFPYGPPDDIVKRLNREEAILRGSPNLYGLLIAYKVIKTLRYHRFKSYFYGDWFCSYYVWLMGLTEENPIELALYYRDIGLQMKQLVRDNCVDSPIEIAVLSGVEKAACLELIRQYAKEWGFWISQCDNTKNDWKLINECYHDDDIYAKYAPVIRIIEGSGYREIENLGLE